MPTSVLVPMDGSTPSKEALAYAFDGFPDANVTVIHVINPLEAGYTADPMGQDYDHIYRQLMKQSVAV